ncbi:MAG: tetratricopeptide repeat protein [Eubacterium sp.]|nr:tetratricopeptide repeat protein [Eubacterium sp.]
MLKKAGILTAALCLTVLLAACGGIEPLTSYEKGMAAYQSGDLNTAQEYFTDSSQTKGEEAAGFRGLGLIYMNRRDYPEAINAFMNCLDAVEHQKLNEAFIEDTRMYLANAYVLDGQPDKAITLYSQMLDSSHASEAYLLRGKLYAKEKKFGQAGQDFQRAIELDPSFEVYLQIYDVYLNMNLQADGAAYLKEARSKATNSTDDAYQMGRICYLLGDPEAARDHLLRAVQGGVPGAGALLGRVYLDQGDLAAARNAFQNCVDQGKEIAAGYNGLALCAIEEENYEEALRLIHTGLQGANTAVAEELLYNEIVVYERQYDFTSALSKMEAFVNSYPGNSAARKEYLFLQSRIQEMNSVPEDISHEVWDDIIRQWEEEEAQAAEEETYEEVYEEEYTDSWEEDNGGWVFDPVTGEWYDPEDLEGVYYQAYTEGNY